MSDDRLPLAVGWGIGIAFSLLCWYGLIKLVMIVRG